MSQTRADWLDDFAAIVKTGSIIDLARPLAWDTPSHVMHTPFMGRLASQHGDAARPGDVSVASDVFTMGTHVGTHIDGLGHIGHCGLIHGGVDPHTISTRRDGFTQFGAETIRPFVCRGVLLDVAGYLGVEHLPADREITLSDIQGTAHSQGISIKAGDCVCIRTGWTKTWHDIPTYIGGRGGAPGPGRESAVWLGEQKIFATGADTLAWDKMPSNGMPAHVEFLVKRGIYIIEVLDLEELAERAIYEFIFAAAPLKIVGATGAPLRPFAII
ncbi:MULTISPECIES: cyclase family protein [unclassified Chelatococcus]|uniref:cyclase family protein n=1 Tax=unclassified Chelatococcus TaxID=2638111 RepID=UPI001BCA9E51|nr:MULTISPECIES: cyclase family protein [unclassified Chelatococcus]MBS7700321.1 cyclase family protein [Chelatococcus sp. YT9]MBX3556117.1 cyclase family protein [Chelatococcus sp.]